MCLGLMLGVVGHLGTGKGMFKHSEVVYMSEKYAILWRWLALHSQGVASIHGGHAKIG